MAKKCFCVNYKKQSVRPRLLPRAKKSVMKKTNKKKIIINVCITVAVFLLAAFYLTRSKTVTGDSIKNVGIGDCVIVLCFFFFALLLYALTDFFVYRTFTDNMPVRKCIMNTLAGNLGSNVTPLKSGHFPLMAYYRYVTGIPPAESVAGLVKCQIIYSTTSTFVYAALSVLLACMGTSFVFEGITVRLWLVILIGFLFHAAVLGGILVLSFCKGLQIFAVRLWGKLLVKLKKVDSIEDYVKEKGAWFDNYRAETLVIYKKFYRYIPACACYSAFMLAFGSVQYVAYVTFTGEAFSFDTMFIFYTLNIAAAYITNVIPVPGGVGTAEVIFTLVYACVIPESIIGSVLILWRAGSYYLATIAEAVAVPVALFAKRKNRGENETRREEISENKD